MPNFLQNKYTKWYYSIISSAKNRKEISSYFEKHHIIPKSLGGNNKKENLVILTAREHCGKSTNKGNYKRWHGINCKNTQGELKFLD